MGMLLDGGTEMVVVERELDLKSRIKSRNISFLRTDYVTN